MLVTHKLVKSASLPIYQYVLIGICTIPSNFFLISVSALGWYLTDIFFFNLVFCDFLFYKQISLNDRNVNFQPWRIIINIILSKEIKIYSKVENFY